MATAECTLYKTFCDNIRATIIVYKCRELSLSKKVVREGDIKVQNYKVSED